MSPAAALGLSGYAVPQQHGGTSDIQGLIIGGGLVKRARASAR